MKKLVEKRNAQFCEAVNESVCWSARDPPSDSRDRLLARTSETVDPVSLLQNSGRKFTPVNTAWNGEISNDPSEIPSSEDRPSVTDIIEEIKNQNWYKGQITFRQETEEKAARPGLGSTLRFPPLHLTCGLRNSWNALIDDNHKWLVRFTTNILPLLPPSGGSECTSRRLTRHR